MTTNTLSTPWADSPQAVAAGLSTDLAQGLRRTEAESRLAMFGPNVIDIERRRTVPAILWAQCANLMVGLLVAAGVISAVVGDWKDALLISGIVVLNIAIGFFQEHRAEEALAQLKSLAQPTARVRRDGITLEVPAESLVPGDLVEIAAGAVVPADARIVAAVELQVDEAPLTGESLPVDKQPESVAEDAALGDRTDMLFAGTSVAAGRGLAVVTATGTRTELGTIATLLEGAGSGPTPLARRMTELSRWLALVVGLVCVVVFVAGVAQDTIGWQSMLLVSVSLAVAAIPEGLPAVVTIALAMGSQRMAARKAIVRQLTAVETLGCVNVICVDKTGTLTESRMTVTDVAPADESEDGLGRLWRAAVLCNDAQPTDDGTILGSATEKALLAGAIDTGLDVAALRERWPREAEFPFDSARKRMSTQHTHGGRTYWFVKGSAESVLGRSRFLARGDDRVPLDDAHRSAMYEQIEQWARDGRRVLAIARRDGLDVAAGHEANVVERELTLLGLVGIADTIRPEAAPAIARCRSAGIRVVMLTGDHASTARRIADDLGMLAEGSEVITGPELERMSDDELKRRAAKVAVYARVSPAHKLRIVRAEQAAGHVTAMTGDGVNDAPALKQADIGIAMGVTGTEVSKQAAKMILADENFATIVAAVEEGRVVYDNIRKFVRYLLTANFGEILILAVAVVLGWPLPLVPVQLLWINLVTDGLPAVALAYEPAELGIMARPPRRRNASIFAGGMIWSICGLAGLMAASCLIGYRISLHLGEDYARSMVFTIAAFYQLFLVLSLRSHTQWFLGKGFTANPRLLGAVALGLVLQLAVIYWPTAQPWFHTAPLWIGDLGLAVLLALSGFAVGEVTKAGRSVKRQAI